MPTIANVKSQIDQLITDANGLLLTKDLADKIRETVTVKSAWSQIKNSGDRAFKTEKQAATNLLTDLDNVGIVTVRVGELERFLTTADASKGPGFLKVAFDEGAHRADDAQKHATRLLTAAGVDFKPAT
jgi:hypothetical protein